MRIVCRSLAKNIYSDYHDKYCSASADMEGSRSAHPFYIEKSCEEYAAREGKTVDEFKAEMKAKAQRSCGIGSFKSRPRSPQWMFILRLLKLTIFCQPRWASYLVMRQRHQQCR